MSIFLQLRIADRAAASVRGPLSLRQCNHRKREESHFTEVVHFGLVLKMIKIVIRKFNSIGIRVNAKSNFVLVIALECAIFAQV